MSTIRTVAKLAGVSIATVSRVMNEPSKVREDTRLRVETAMRELNFERNSFAASLATQRSDCIGLIVAHLSGAFFAPLINKVEEVVSRAGSYLVISCGKNSVSEVEGALQFMRQRRCDAIILFPGHLSDEALKATMAANPTLVVIHRIVEGFEERCVAVDNRAGARLAARFLIDCGRQQIGVITGPASNPESEDRLSAFRDTLLAAGVQLATQLIVEGDFGSDSGRRGMAELLAAQIPLNAVFCLNDQMAIGALDYCRAAGIEIPRQISLIGFDDVEYADLVHPRLTTVHQPIEALAVAAAEIALSLAAGLALAGAIKPLTPRLVIRDSVQRIS